jgi:hypothetical protein
VAFIVGHHTMSLTRPRSQSDLRPYLHMTQECEMQLAAGSRHSSGWRNVADLHLLPAIKQRYHSAVLSLSPAWKREEAPNALPAWPFEAEVSV